MKLEMKHDEVRGWKLALRSLRPAMLALCVWGATSSFAATPPFPGERASARIAMPRPLPVLLVIADRADFHYGEYAATRRAIEGAGVAVRVAATTVAPSLPHPNTGQLPGMEGIVVPDIPLSKVRSRDYSAIAFVGGWGASQYQYAYNDPDFDGQTDQFYAHEPYNGDADLDDGRVGEGKRFVNALIGDFIREGKPVAGICHGTTVLAWARVDGVSPLKGRRVAVSFIGSPATFYQGRWYADYELGQREQVVANGGDASSVSGEAGVPTTTTDDVIVDDRIITAENHDSAPLFGRVLSKLVMESVGGANQTGIQSPEGYTLAFGGTEFPWVDPIAFGPYLAVAGRGSVLSGGDDLLIAGRASHDDAAAINVGLFPAVSPLVASPVRMGFSSVPTAFASRARFEGMEEWTDRGGAHSGRVSYEGVVAMERSSIGGGFGLSVEMAGTGPIAYGAFLGGVRVAAGDLEGAAAPFVIESMPDEVEPRIGGRVRIFEARTDAEMVWVLRYDRPVRIHYFNGRLLTADEMTVSRALPVARVQHNLKQLALAVHGVGVRGVDQMVLRQPTGE